MESTNSFVNQYFDQVYVLNLEKRPDRKIKMIQKLSRLGISAEFVKAIDGYSYQNKLEHHTYLEQPVGEIGSHHLEINQQRKLVTSSGAWGYLKTYHGILNDAKKRGFERILCFDDDVLFHNDFENQFKEAVEIIPEDWKLLYLGASQYIWTVPQGLSYPDQNKKAVDPKEPFYYPNKTDGSFAMGINVSVFDLLINDILKMNCPFDSGPLRTVIDAYPKNCYALYPNIVVADVSDSDIRESQDQKQIGELLKWNLADYDSAFKQDLVSVIMPAFNAESSIEKSIRSILMQSYSSLEIIVVDDESTDKTVTIVKQLIKEDSRIQLISLTTNKGVGGARNVGILASKGKIIAFQDADDISLKNRIAIQLVPFYEKDVIFTISRFYRSHCTIEELDIIDQDKTMTLVKSRRTKNNNGLFDYRDIAHIGLVTILYKRKVFEIYGLFDEHRFGEDMEFVERILFYRLNKTFLEKYNGHTFLSDHNSITKTFQRIDKPLYISPEMTENNLTIEYRKKKKESLTIQQTFRNKYRSGGLDQFSKLSIEIQQTKSPSINYNTLVLDTFVKLPELDHQILLDLVKEAKEAKKLHLASKDILNSLSWKITAPLRWFGKLINRLNQLLK